MKFKLGSKVKCKHTGFQGVIMSRAEHLNGCMRYQIQPAIDKDGKLPDGYWFDEIQLELISEPVEEHKAVATGGPMTRVCMGEM